MSAPSESRPSEGAQPRSDYTRVAAAIRFLDACAEAQPSLDEVAAHVGLSPFHFQRIFRRWAGVSPKRFLQFVTASHARVLLEGSRGLLEVALESGLSGPGRLHDLVVAVHAMTPAELRGRGAGLTLRYGLHETPFGLALAAATARGLSALSFVEPGAEEAALDALRERWSGARLVEDGEATGEAVARIFGGERAELALHVAGTNFQVRVWEALLRIPPGAVTTYGAIAQHLGLARGARAVGGAVAANPVAYLIPCHRVIRGTAAFGDYRWDPTRKRAMLAREAAAAARDGDLA